MEHPEIFTPAAYEKVVHSMQPVYALTKGLTNKAITKLVRQVLDTRPLKTEYLPEEIRGAISWRTIILQYVPYIFREYAGIAYCQKKARV